MAKVKQYGITQHPFAVDPGTLTWTSLDELIGPEGGSIVPPKEQKAKLELSKPVKTKPLLPFPEASPLGWM